MFKRDTNEFTGFGGPRGFGGGFRAGRGMIEPAILRTLRDKPMHGYEIISTLEEKSHGMWRPSAGSVYPTLQLLEEKGLIKSIEQDGKKIYDLTDEGRLESDKLDESFAEAWEHRAEHMKTFRASHDDMRRIMGSMRTIMHKGDEDQKNALTGAIKEFRQTVEKIMKGTI